MGLVCGSDGVAEGEEGVMRDRLEFLTPHFLAELVVEVAAADRREARFSGEDGGRARWLWSRRVR